MARIFFGPIATLIKGSSTGGVDAVITGTSRVTVSGTSAPFSYLEGCLFGVSSQGVSGNFSVTVVGGIGGMTNVIAGFTSVSSTTGGLLFGTTNITQSLAPTAVPRPQYVAFSSAKNSSGFTATVFMWGKYGGY